MIQSKGYAAQDKTAPLTPFHFERRDPGPKDVVVDIEFCGICHSDLHQVRDEWGGSMYPMVPGHEIVGKVAAVGSDVTKFKVGDAAAVGVTVETCMVCENCKAGAEPYCLKGMVGTYNAKTYEASPPTAATPTISSLPSTMCTPSRPSSMPPPWLLSSAPASPPGRPCDIGALARANASASLASAVSATWV